MSRPQPKIADPVALHLSWVRLFGAVATNIYDAGRYDKAAESGESVAISETSPMQKADSVGSEVSVIASSLLSFLV